jgi:hypothetical protein
MATRNWIMEEFERASARFDKLPEYAKPVITKPIVSARTRDDDGPPSPTLHVPQTS